MSAFIEFPFPTVLKNLDAPVDPTDSVTKEYVDTLVAVGGGGGGGGATAEMVAFTPVGNLVATNVQAALQEVDANKLSLDGGNLTGNLAIAETVGPIALRNEITSSAIRFTGVQGANSAVTQVGLGVIDMNVASAPSDYSRTVVNVGTVALLGPDGNPAIPTLPQHVTTKSYVDTVTDNFIPKTGSADLTGEFNLSDGVATTIIKSGSIEVFDTNNEPVMPVSDTELAPKGYIDGLFLLINDVKVNKSGDTMTGQLSMIDSGGNVILPTLTSHVATKQYVDSIATGLKLSLSSDVTTTENITGTYTNGDSGYGATLSGTGAPLVIDGVTLDTDGTRVLVKNQNDATENGIYELTVADDGGNWQLTRSTDADTASELINGLITFVSDGDTNAASSWVLVVSGQVNVGDTDIHFTQFGDSVNYASGEGIAIIGSTIINDGILDVVGTPNEITVDVASKTATISLPETVTMPGELFVNTPTEDLHAATKLYVDDAIAALPDPVTGDFLSVTGGTMTGQINMTAAVTTANNVATKSYVDTSISSEFSRLSAYNLNIMGTSQMANNLPMNSYRIVNLAGPSSTSDAATKGYVDTTNNSKLSVAGGIMTGSLTLDAPPTIALHAATKGYVDANVAAINTAKVDKSGDTMTGHLTLSSDPTTNFHAATKHYVDVSVNGVRLAGDFLSTDGGTIDGDLSINGALNIAVGNLYIRDGEPGQILASNGADPASWVNPSTIIGNAAAIPFTPTTSITSTNVQAAIEEVKNESVAKNGDKMTGHLTLSSAPLIALHAATKAYVDAADATKLSLSGGTMTGSISMNPGKVIIVQAAPTSAFHATNKEYVDSLAATKLSLTGGSMSGQIIMTTDPTLDDHVATKTYVDTQDALKLNLSGGTLTGPLTLSAAPTADLQAATKKYVDDASMPLGASEYVAVVRTGGYQTNVGTGTDLIFNRVISSSGSIGSTYNTGTGVWTLTAGKTYELYASIITVDYSITATGFCVTQWVFAANNVSIINQVESGASTNRPLTSSANESTNGITRIYYTPSTDVTVKLRVTGASGTCAMRNNGSTAIVQQIGSSSLTGNVSLGGGAESTSTTTGGLVVNGGLGVSGTITATNIINQTPLDYVKVAFSVDYNISTTVNATIPFNKIIAQNGEIAYNSAMGAFVLRAGKTYRLQAIIGGSGTTSTSHLAYQWRNTANAAIGGTSTGVSCSIGTRSDALNPIADAIYTPVSDENVFLKVTSSQGGAIIAKPDTQSGWSTAWATVIQLR